MLNFFHKDKLEISRMASNSTGQFQGDYSTSDRGLFACLIMTGLCANSNPNISGQSMQKLAIESVEAADILLKILELPKGSN